jgi:hypothetical protein
MPPFPFRQALDQFQAEIAAAITSPTEAGALASFVDEFAGDFDGMLSNDRGDAVWRRDGPRVRSMGRTLGVFAQFVATAAGGNSAAVTKGDLKKALKDMRPHCHVPEEEGAPAGLVKRRKYCEGVEP